MAVGDVINSNGALGSNHTFTPAAGVEIIVIGWSIESVVRLMDAQGMSFTTGVSANSDGARSIKVGITNSYPIYLQAAGLAKNWFSGIQIK